ncbi:type I restriction endonuclease subunit R [Nitrospira moscoviensis]|uniref:Type I restriction enzyme endonuclease subunit n=1 Tax=Nitrospira moscoviensis TaxID=42253 RepID=A0A0K2GA96_NITMO|nr:type I restriction endonuclease subunit R [Nitrospira moscoviensis]ALA57891.1 Type I site-specific deoxyribonuclease, HsdR family [Nitrospira moscoviensis]
MAQDYSEAQLVEQPAIGLLSKIGWRTLSAVEESFGPTGTLGRETKSEAVLVSRLRGCLERLNPSLPPEAISAAIDQLSRDRSAMGLSAANREIYGLLKDGIPVSIQDKGGGQKTERVRVIDWENPAANDFLLVNQFSVTGSLYTRRPDLVGFVNGLPLIVVELKKPGVPAQQAFDDNLTCYKSDIPQLFWFNGLMIASNGTESRVGSLTADWERFFEWKRIEREDEPRRVSLEVMLRGTCEPSRLLDLLENFTLFSEHKAGLVKVLSQNHQFLGVNNAIAATLTARKQGHGRGGVFWQTQGSGKSLAMVFFAQKILRKVPGNWTFVVVTDRVELDDQIAKTFKACGAVSETESDLCHARSGAQLRQLLSENHRYVFTLIHKFQTPEVLCDRSDVIVLTDEAHRSQYDTLALNMRAALPRALFLAFTGTPLIAGEERTREVFGDYVSIYDFQQSVEDGATVPLFYENRTPELRLENPNLNDDIYNLIEAAGLDDEQEKRLERELGRQYQILTRDDRLETIARDIVQHFLGRGFQGKAMVISIDKATVLRMLDKVKKHWQAEQKKVEQELARLTTYGAKDARPEKIRELTARLDVIRTTDMAVIVSPGQNEIEQMKKLGLDIAPHRKRMNDESLDEKFKDPDDPLRLVFVCAMWLTGFDAPSCSTVYLDKPMRNHTLMQTIARANRVFPGKHSGLIVDYANVFTSLEKALAIYAKGKGGERPIRDKQKLVESLRQAISAATAFCQVHGVSLEVIEKGAAGSLERLTQIAEAVEALISPDPLRKDFLAQERWVRTLFHAVKPDPSVLEFASRVACLTTIAETIRERTGEGPVDISAVMTDLNKILDASVAADGFHIPEGTSGHAVIDLAKIDFEALSKRFGKSKTKNTDLEQLKGAIRAQLDKLVRLNRTRADYLAKFEELIESYNAGSRNIEELFKELLALSRSLNEEQERHVREHLSEEELVIFDILTRPAPELSVQERAELKKVAKDLLEKLKQLLVLNWRQTVAARSRVKLAIEDLLDQGLPRAYTPDLYKQKCSAVFEHVYEAYGDRGTSLYRSAGLR